MSSPDPKLTFGNFHIWRAKMEVYLKTLGMWPIVSGHLTVTRFLSTSAGAARLRRLQAWIKRCHCACGTILLNVSDDLILEFECTENPTHLWNEIKENYLEGLPRSDDLVTIIESIKVVNEGTVEAYVMKLRNAYMDYEMTCEAEDTESYLSLSFQIMNGAPDDWEVHSGAVKIFSEERMELGHEMSKTAIGCLMRFQDKECCRRGIGKEQPLFVNGVYAAGVIAGG